jgi:zinc protease
MLSRVAALGLAVALAAGRLTPAWGVDPDKGGAGKAAVEKQAPGGVDERKAVATPVVNDALAIDANPAVTQGVLPNGLRYALRHNESPRGGVSIRLAVAAGAYDAEENEVGVAHFVEHMTFAGAGPSDETAYANAFQGFGVDHGRDRNAHTSLRETSYELDLPESTGPALDLAFRWLRQVADGATFPAAGVETEKGVLLNESRERQVAAYQAILELGAFEEMRTRDVRRKAADPEDSIRATTPERLKTFYAKWYRPDNAVLVMVGDLPLEEMRQRLAAAFGSWKPSQAGPLPRHAAFDTINLRAPPAEDVVLEPNGIPMLAACRNQQGVDDHLDTLPKLRRATASDAWANILTERLSRLTRQPDAPFSNAVMGEDDNDKAARGACLTMFPRAGDWQRGLAAVQTELRRFAAFGPSDQELKDAVHDLRVSYWSQHKSETVGASPAMAAALADALALGDPIPGDDADAVFDKATKGLTVADVRAAFAADWAGSGVRLAYVTSAAPPAGALTKAWADGEAAPAPTTDLAAAKPVIWPYASFGKPGKVVARQAFPTLDMVRLTFANGVVAYVKTLDGEAERKVVARVSFGAGRRELAPNEALSGMLGAKLTPFMGLKKIGFADMRRALQEHAWQVDYDIGDTQSALGGTTWPSDLNIELQVLAAFVTEPGFRDEVDATLPEAMRAGLRVMRAEPAAAVQLALGDALRPGLPSLLPGEADLTRLRASDFAAQIGPDLTIQPLEITLVGAIDEKTATPLLAATFGALPPRVAVDRSRPDAWFIKGFDKPLAPIRVNLPGARTAAVGAVWPLWDGTPDRRREEKAVEMAGRILSDQLRKRIREQLGKTYSPAVEVDIADHSDQGLALALVDTDPADVEQVRAEVTAAAAGVAAGHFDQDALDRARTPYLAQVDQARTQDMWWANLIATTHGDPAKIREAVNERDIVASLSLDEVKQAAAAWFSATPTLITALPERAGAPAAAKP